MGVEKLSAGAVIGLILIVSTALADDFDFQVSVEPTTIGVANCRSLSTLAVTAKNPFLISSMDIYADSQNICRLGNGETNICYYNPSDIIPAGTSPGQKTKTLTIQGVGVSGTFDSGKTKIRTFNLIIQHSPSGLESSANSAMQNAQSRIDAAKAKVNEYSSKGYDMSIAWPHLSTAGSSIEQAKSSFYSCSFETAQSLALQAQSSADQAISQAENAFQAQKPPLTGEILGSKSESTAALIGISIFVIAVITAVIIFIRRRSKK